MQYVIIIGLFAALVLIFFAVQRRLSAIADREWDTAAEGLGLRHRRRGLSEGREMTGKVSGLRVRVDTVVRGSGNQKRMYTRYEVRHSRRIGFALKLTREGVLSRIGKLLGRKDIEVGDPGFDEKVKVSGRHPRRAAEFLTPSRRECILRALSADPGLEIREWGLVLERSGVNRSETIRATLEALVGVSLSLVPPAEGA